MVGHSSHYQPELVQFSREHEIILFCLPPHTTHESQPLDTSVFGPLKRNWQLVCHKYIQKHHGKLVMKYRFSGLLNKAWMKTMTPSNICSGFHTCGIYPFNPDAIDCGIDVEGCASHNKHSDILVILMIEMNFLLKHWQGFRKDTTRAMICMMKNTQDGLNLIILLIYLLIVLCWSQHHPLLWLIVSPQ